MAALLYPLSIVLAAASPAMFGSAARATPPEVHDRTLSCTQPFGVDLTEAKLAALFGAANITHPDLTDREGLEYKPTVLFENNSADRVELIWSDGPDKKLQLADILGANWSGPEQIHIGSTLAEVEKANGRPFTFVDGGGVDGDGQASDWQGGRLGTLPGGCELTLNFPTVAPGYNSSDAPVLRAANPRVTEMLLVYVGDQKAAPKD